jgi:uncharacterized Fe-S cluster-containing radical SAM superfamily protein
MNAIVAKLRELIAHARIPWGDKVHRVVLAGRPIHYELHPDATIVSEKPFVVATTGRRFAYAISFPVDSPNSLTAQPRRAVVRLKVRRGRIGVGVVSGDGQTYIAERQATLPDETVSVPVPAGRVGDVRWITLRNTATGSQACKFELVSVDFIDDRVEPATSLRDVTLKPFKAKAYRAERPKVASINTTDVCDLSCVMCHFNGPKATKKAGALVPSQVEKVLREIPAGEQIWFCATGEFFIDPNALSYLRRATELSLKPCVLTHGQLFKPKLMDDVLEAGVRLIRMSVDSSDADQYRKIRRGGELGTIIEACRYLRAKKASSYPDLRVEINATLFKTTFAKQSEMEAFWRPLVDQVNFNAEYFNTFQFRNIFYQPQDRVDCDIELYIMPSGRIVPCCAMAVYQHDNDVSWLPHVDEVSSLREAYDRLCDLYEDPNGPMAPLCAKCDWWIMFMPGNSPYIRAVDLEKNA